MKIIQNGDIFAIGESMNVHDKLPLGVYNLRFSPKQGFYLSKTNDFQLPKKLYGDFSVIKRWINNYNHRDRNLGILLSGLKGSGKTITAKKFCIDLGKPVILIQDQFEDVIGFKSFLTDSVLGDCIIFIDEFEKIYSRESQEDLLSLLDGPYHTHHVYLFTVNQSNINENMNNRPSRIFYSQNYETLDDSVIHDVIDDLLVNKDYAKSIHDVIYKVGIITFDMLISLISEMNLCNEPADICAQYMNFTGEATPIIVHQLINNTEKEATNDRYCNFLEDNTIDVWSYRVNDDGEIVYDHSVSLDISDIKRISLNEWEYRDDKYHFRIGARKALKIAF